MPDLPAGTGSEYLREVARGYRAALAAAKENGTATRRHHLQVAFSDVLATAPDKPNEMYERLGKLIVEATHWKNETYRMRWDGDE